MSLTTYLARRNRSQTCKTFMIRQEVANPDAEPTPCKEPWLQGGDTEEIALEVETIERMSPASN